MGETDSNFFLALWITILSSMYCCALEKFADFRPLPKDQRVFKLTTYRRCCCVKVSIIPETDESCTYYRQKEETECGCCKRIVYREIGANEAQLYDGLDEEIQVCLENARRARLNDLKASKSPNDAMIALLEKEYTDSDMELLDDDQEYDQLAMTQTVYDEQLGSDSEPQNDSAIYAAIAFPAIAGLVLGAICWKKRAALKIQAQEETDDYIAI